MSQILYRECTNWFLGSKSKNLDIEGPWRAKMISEIIASYYSSIKPKQFNNLYEIELQFIDLSKYKTDYLKHIEELTDEINDTLKGYLSNALIHGSLSDLTYKKGWSDLDTFFIINRDTSINSKKLLELRNIMLNLNKYIYKIDNLAHHEFIFISEFDLINFSSYFMPRQVLNNSKSLLLNPNKIFLYENTKEKNLNTLKRFKEKVILFKKFVETNFFYHHPYNNEYLNSNLQKYNNRMYQLKYFLETIMTLPAYYLEAIGKPTQKNESFHIKEEFRSCWAIVDKCTKIRDMWETKENHPYNSNLIPSWLIKILGNNFHIESYELIIEMNKKIFK